ncbi:MAG: tRNA (N6-isopentenyl adenosine(37)-C2)-methylthiotransferase MiaB [Oxalobacter sp.]|jgi:tRNA-2-methylthio-N6-dimethylallyladenosine synthase|nr:tRNA (N6-isopentenyl adenosine(37)-C2)-methylthiotransferase MiaB [Oxalobacter sp.]MBR6000342.1 tRNA (N6-isopentenyl adenosine(37)-C2)-methylthiotransferase MiaB [Oxalobacter sp.]
MPKKVFIKTFGCQMNEYDSSKIAALLEAESGYVLTDSPEDADLILLNTCSVREKAQEKVFSDLGRFRRVKKGKPDVIIGVAGCVASQEGQAIIKRAPYVNVVMGPQAMHRLPQMLDAYEKTGEPQVDISFPEIEKFDYLPPARIEGVTAYISIMEGCSKYCSYCIVPYTRGAEVSRRFEDVLTEIAEAAEQGIREITLLGQNVNAYRGALDDGSTADFTMLLEYAAEIPGIERIRFVTSHPREFNSRLIDAYSRIPKLVSHLYLPAQHGSDKILAAMKRGYTALEYKSIIRRLKAIRPDLLVSSDFIVGFPGETDDDFNKLMQLIEDVGFDNSFSFLYSPRPGTPAASLPIDTPLDVRKERLAILQAKIDENTRHYNQMMVGTIQPVLIEQVSHRNSQSVQGKTDNNKVVHIPVTGNPESLIGQIRNVKITEAANFSLRGEFADGTIR